VGFESPPCTLMANQHEPTRKRGYKYFFSLGKIEVDSDTGCWIWLGAQFDDGYGKINRKTGDKWIPVTAQRYFFEQYRQSLPREIEVSHSCHRRLCVRLRHLRPMTHPENMRLMFENWEFGATDLLRVKELITEGRTVSYIADALMSPRPYIMKVLKKLNGAQDGLFT
jgi:hypothetical protein